MMIKYFKKATAGLLLAGVHSLAFASPCDSAISSYSWYIENGYPEDAAEIVANHPECFGGGSATSSTQITATAFTQATAISRAINSRLNIGSGGPIASVGTTTGLAAGGMPQAWNVWGNINQNDTRFRYTSPTAARVRGANDIFTAVIGGDYAWAPNMVVGVSVAFDDGNGWGQNNAAAKNMTDTDGYLIAPYLGYQINKEWAVDVSAGLGSGDFSATGGVKAEADRWFAAANLSYARWMNNWQFTGKASYLHGEEDYGNTKINGVTALNTDSKNTLDQVRVGAQAGYWMNGFMPYAGLSYTADVHRSSSAGSNPLGRDSFVMTLGANFFSLSSKVTGGIFYEQELSRKRSDNQVIAANINFRF